MLFQTSVIQTSFPQVCALSPSFGCRTVSFRSNTRLFKFPFCFVVTAKSDLNSGDELSLPVELKLKNNVSRKEGEGGDDGMFPLKSPRKPRRGRKSEAVAVEEFVRGSLEQTFASIRGKNAEVIEKMESIMKEQTEKSVDVDVDDSDNSDDEGEEKDVTGGEKKMVVDEENEHWPIDTDVGWGIRASEYFEQHSIKNVVGEDGVEIDWEGEVEDSWLKEINCLEWESFAFHPSPLIVLVFERYKRAKDNWMVLKELEKAAEVYCSAKDRLPPPMVKLDINIERDLAYALKVKSGPQVLFLKGNRILYREKEIRTSNELVQMIAHFYYKAKKPSWIDDAALSPGPYWSNI